jgi:hypothetical protein
MEDISRELEKEIALSRPKPHKQDRKAKLFIIDDFGKMKSGEYFKILVKVLLFVSVVCFITASVFGYLYTELSKSSGSLHERLAVAENKAADLTREKEVLMARLVISGKEPGLVGEGIVTDGDGSEMSSASDLVAGNKSRPLENQDSKLASAVSGSAKTQADNSGATINNAVASAVKASGESGKNESGNVIKKIVSIEKFTVVRDGVSTDLLVRFDIRNISDEPGDVSGRIFTVLKPDSGSQNKWLVVPSAPLKNGVPSEYRRGQYFSIAHFKPVKFRIKNQADPGFFKKASIFIFNSQGDLVFEELIDITEAE